jgi:hypothetical protein
MMFNISTNIVHNTLNYSEDGLEVNTENIKYMFKSHHQNGGHSHN